MKYKAENFGKNIEIILNTLDMSQADLAWKTDLTPAAISQIISGKRDPSLSTVIKILNVLPVKFERLVR